MGTKFVVLVVVVLAIIAVAQIMRVYELSSKLKGRREEDIDLKVNNINAAMMIVFLIIFFGSFFYMLFKYERGLLPEAASEIGQEIDWLYNVNWFIVVFVFLLTNSLLFIFAWKYSWHPDRKAYWFPHDNKLELIWTVVPAAVLAVIIILGLIKWGDITGAPSDDARLVEIYGKQFDWTIRYAGDDNQLGYSDYKLVGNVEYKVNEDSTVSYSNPLGVVSQNSIRWAIQGINQQITELHENIKLDSIGAVVYSEAKSMEQIVKVEKLERIRERIIDMTEMYSDSIDAFAKDDYMTKAGLFLIKDQEYQFILRSQDVLHSAYFPHFRAQMNCVPGQRTTLKFKPIYTTEEMREKTGNPEFNYILMCNKICGASHYRMKLPVMVGTEDEFNAWQMDNTGLAIADSVVAPAVIDMERMEMPEPAHHGDEHHDEDHGEGDGHDEEGHNDEAHNEEHH